MSQPNTRIDDQSAFDAALELSRGEYQRNVLRGVESLSGATLRGRARNYSGRYGASRRNLFDRMTTAGIPWREERGAHGKRILVLGAEDPYAALPPMFPMLLCAAGFTTTTTGAPTMSATPIDPETTAEERAAHDAGRAWAEREQSAQLDGSAGRYWEPTVYDAIGVLPDGIEADDLYRLAGIALDAAKTRAAEMSAEFCAALDQIRDA